METISHIHELSLHDTLLAFPGCEPEQTQGGDDLIPESGHSSLQQIGMHHLTSRPKHGFFSCHVINIALDHPTSYFHGNLSDVYVPSSLSVAFNKGTSTELQTCQIRFPLRRISLLPGFASMCIRLNFHAAFTPCDGTYEIIAFGLVPLPSLEKLPQHKMMKSCPFNPFATSFGASSDVAGAHLSHACRGLTQVCVASIAVFMNF